MKYPTLQHLYLLLPLCSIPHALAVKDRAEGEPFEHLEGKFEKEFERIQKISLNENWESYYKVYMTEEQALAILNLSFEGDQNKEQKSKKVKRASRDLNKFFLYESLKEKEENEEGHDNTMHNKLDIFKKKIRKAKFIMDRLLVPDNWFNAWHWTIYKPDMPNYLWTGKECEGYETWKVEYSKKIKKEAEEERKKMKEKRKKMEEEFKKEREKIEEIEREYAKRLRESIQKSYKEKKRREAERKRYKEIKKTYRTHNWTIDGKSVLFAWEEENLLYIPFARHKREDDDEDIVGKTRNIVHPATGRHFLTHLAQKQDVQNIGAFITMHYASSIYPKEIVLDNKDATGNTFIDYVRAIPQETYDRYATCSYKQIIDFYNQYNKNKAKKHKIKEAIALITVLLIGIVLLKKKKDKRKKHKKSIISHSPTSLSIDQKQKNKGDKLINSQ